MKAILIALLFLLSACASTPSSTAAKAKPEATRDACSDELSRLAD